MSIVRLVRPIAAGVVAAAVGACAGHHTYGVTLPDTGTWNAQQYLITEGFHDVPMLKGEQFSMERQHGDSVDKVHFVRGGPAPAIAGFTMPGTGGAAYVGPGGTGGVSQTAYSGSGGGYMMGMPGGGSGGLVLEIMSFRVDRKGRRSAIEPGAQLFQQADSIISLVTRIPSSMRQ